jgi:hypothetical protein
VKQQKTSLPQERNTIVTLMDIRPPPVDSSTYGAAHKQLAASRYGKPTLVRRPGDVLRDALDWKPNGHSSEYSSAILSQGLGYNDSEQNSGNSHHLKSYRGESPRHVCSPAGPRAAVLAIAWHSAAALLGSQIQRSLPASAASSIAAMAAAAARRRHFGAFASPDGVIPGWVML